jgi:DNA-binding NtrC family response regulator
MTTILIVDDDRIYRTFLHYGLSLAGHRVLLAGTGEEAMRCLRGTAVSVLVTNILMAETDGLELIRGAKLAQPGMSIVAISGGGAPIGGDFLHAAGLLGADAALAKPFNCGDLIAAIEPLTGLGAMPSAPHLPAEAMRCSA